MACNFSLYFLYKTGSESGIGLWGALVGVCVLFWLSGCAAPGVADPLLGPFLAGGPGVVFPLGSALPACEFF